MQIKLGELPDNITKRALEHSVVKGIRRKPRVFVDTKNFTAIDCGDIICVDGRFFLVTSYTKEGRFGVDDQPKPWVPKVIDLASGVVHILKLVFHETFDLKLGEFKVT